MSGSSSRAKIRILCLHGYRQSATKFKGQTNALRKSLKRIVELVYIDAPLVVPYVPGPGTVVPEDPTRSTQYTWWHFTENGPTIEYRGVSETLAYLDSVWETQGPFDGVLGFSQGGMCAQVWLAQRTSPAFRFAIFLSTCTPRDLSLLKPDTTPILPTFHCWGSQDTIIPEAKSQALANRFPHAHTCVHSGGHYVPGTRDVRDALHRFLASVENPHSF